MAKIMLLNPPGDKLYLRDQHCNSESKADYYWQPIDLVMLSGILSDKHEIYVLDSIIENVNEEDTLNKIMEYYPNFIISLTGTVSWNNDISFIKKIKENTSAKIIISGGLLIEDHIKIMTEYPFIDAILMDFTSYSINDYIDEKFDKVFDMCIREGNQIINKPKSNLREFSISVPKHELFPIKKYRLPHNKQFPFASVLTNYGCPYECSFCIASCVDFKFRPVENVIAELEKLYNMGVKEIFFKDFTFGIPKAISMKLCNEIINRFPKLTWICSSRVNVMEEDILLLMKKAGCHTIQFGVESGSQELLDSTNKQIDVEQIKRIFKLCDQIGIRTLAHFILGLPGETEDSIKDTIKLAKIIKCDFASFNVASPTYGTKLRKVCIENNWIQDELYDFDSSNGYPTIETPYISKEKLWKLRNYAVKSFYLRPSYIFRKLTTIQSISEFKVLIREGISLILILVKNMFLENSNNISDKNSKNKEIISNENNF